MAEIERIEAEFQGKKNQVEARGNKQTKKVVEDFAAVLGGLKDIQKQILDCATDQATLGLKIEAAANAGDISQIDELSRGLQANRDRAMVLEEFRQAAEARVETSWGEFLKGYETWLVAEGEKVVGRALEVYGAGVAPAVEGLRLVAERIGELEREAIELGDRQSVDLVRGLQLVVDLAADALSVKVGGEARIELPKADTGRESRFLYGVRRNLLESMPRLARGNRNNGLDTAVINGLTLITTGGDLVRHIF